MALKNTTKSAIKNNISALFLALTAVSCCAWSTEQTHQDSPTNSVQSTESPQAAQDSEPTPSAQSTVYTKIQEISDRASSLVTKAVDFLGIRYKRGGNNVSQGLDCSGLVRLVFKDALNVNLPRTALEISRSGEKIDPSELQPGDLVFYNTMRRGFSHVGIYLGENKFIHSPSSGGQVRIESMNVSYWKKRFNGARRISE